MATKSRPLDTVVQVVTPENIAFEYQLAGPFRRLPAFLSDLLVRWGIIGACFIAMLVSGIAIDLQIAGPFYLAAAFMILFLVNWFYGALLETYFNGRTIGKWACGIRVVDVDGHPIDARRAFVRNLLRVADWFPITTPFMTDAEVPLPMPIPTGLVAIISMTLTNRMQRLGDLAAGTMVVIDEKAWRLPQANIEDPRVPALASFIPSDFQFSRTLSRTLATYAERRPYLSPPRRREVAKYLASELIERFGFRRDIDEDLLLHAMYYKSFIADDGEEPDLSPLRGFSPYRGDENKDPILESESDAEQLNQPGPISSTQVVSSGDQEVEKSVKEIA
ncbi:MAG: RDD family protein [Planctomycetota bacterium]